jgi:nucleotide-binding universal stress UspA family protein
MTGRILLAVDESPAASRAIESLEAYGGSPGSAVVVLNVQSRPIELWPAAGLAPGAIDEALLDEGRRIADAAAARLQAKGFAAEAVVRLGFPAQSIVQEAARAKAGMIWMGTRGHGVVQGFSLGSAALRVVHGSAVPVWLVRPEARVPTQLGRRLRVMFGTDGSAEALGAARFLVSWKAWLGELDVQVAYVQPPLSVLEAVLPPHDDVVEQWSTGAGEKAAGAARELFAQASIPSHLHITSGEPAPELVQLAAETKCELLVLGTRGLGAAHHALVGSVALKAAALAGMPVVLVR